MQQSAPTPENEKKPSAFRQFFAAIGRNVKKAWNNIKALFAKLFGKKNTDQQQPAVRQAPLSTEESEAQQQAYRDIISSARPDREAAYDFLNFENKKYLSPELQKTLSELIEIFGNNVPPQDMRKAAADLRLKNAEAKEAIERGKEKERAEEQAGTLQVSSEQNHNPVDEGRQQDAARPEAEALKDALEKAEPVIATARGYLEGVDKQYLFLENQLSATLRNLTDELDNSAGRDARKIAKLTKEVIEEIEVTKKEIEQGKELELRQKNEAAEATIQSQAMAKAQPLIEEVKAYLLGSEKTYLPIGRVGELKELIRTIQLPPKINSVQKIEALTKKLSELNASTKTDIEKSKTLAASVQNAAPPPPAVTAPPVPTSSTPVPLASPPLTTPTPPFELDKGNSDLQELLSTLLSNKRMVRSISALILVANLQIKNAGLLMRHCSPDDVKILKPLKDTLDTVIQYVPLAGRGSQGVLEDIQDRTIALHNAILTAHEKLRSATPAQGAASTKPKT